MSVTRPTLIFLAAGVLSAVLLTDAAGVGLVVSRRPLRPCRTPQGAAERVDEEVGARPELLLSKNATGASLFAASVA